MLPPSHLVWCFPRMGFPGVFIVMIICFKKSHGSKSAEPTIPVIARGCFMTRVPLREISRQPSPRIGYHPGGPCKALARMGRLGHYPETGVCDQSSPETPSVGPTGRVTGELAAVRRTPGRRLARPPVEVLPVEEVGEAGSSHVSGRGCRGDGTVPSHHCGPSACVGRAGRREWLTGEMVPFGSGIRLILDKGLR